VNLITFVYISRLKLEKYLLGILVVIRILSLSMFSLWVELISYFKILIVPFTRFFKLFCLNVCIFILTKVKISITLSSLIIRSIKWRTTFSSKASSPYSAIWCSLFRNQILFLVLDTRSHSGKKSFKLIHVMSPLAKNIQSPYLPPRQLLKDGCAGPKKQTSKVVE